MTREEAVELLNKFKFCCNFYECTNEWECEECVEALYMAAKALEQETVSREMYDHEFNLRKMFEMKVFELERKIAEPKRGKWVGVAEYCEYLEKETGERYQPSGMGNPVYCDQCWSGSGRIIKSYFCPNCGADMRGDE